MYSTISRDGSVNFWFEEPNSKSDDTHIIKINVMDGELIEATCSCRSGTIKIESIKKMNYCSHIKKSIEELKKRNVIK